MGIVVVAAMAARTGKEPPIAKMTATCRRTRSAASADSRSRCSSAQRYSILRFCPSTKPASFKPARKKSVCSIYPSRVELPRKPITGIAGCWPRTSAGHTTAAPPRSVMNSRLRMSFSPMEWLKQFMDYSRSGPVGECQMPPPVSRHARLPRWVISRHRYAAT